MSFPERNTEAVKLAATNYWQQLKHDWPTAVPGLVLPGLGNILVFYVPPLIVAKILVAFCNDNFAGSLTKKVVGYGSRYVDVMDTLAFSVTSSLIPVFFAGFVLWGYSPWLVVALLAMMVIAALVAIPLIKRRAKLVAVREVASNVMAGNVADTISNMTTVRSFTQETYEGRRHASRVKDHAQKMLKSWDYNTLRIEIALSPFFVLTNVVGLTIALALSSNGALNVEAIFVSFSYFVQISGFMWKFNQIYRNLESSLTDAAQFTELLIEQPRVTDASDVKSLKPVKGLIEFMDVSFQYSDSAGRHLFQDLNLKINEGEKVALVGHSGGGKTTITTLLLRFMAIAAGKILIDGQDISKVPQRQLRASIAYVPQDTSLFHRSLADNIRYCKLDAADDEMLKAAKLSHAHDFIKELPKAYETLVGERGVKLSGGQRQD